MLLIAAVSAIVLLYGTPERKADAAALKFTVNTTGDAAAISPYGGCDTNPFLAGDQCTLRSAIQAANYNAGADTIGFRIPSTAPGCDASGNCAINVSSALPTITEAVAITGPGAAKLRIQGGLSFDLFTISTPGDVSISRLTLARGGESQSDYANIRIGSNGTVNVSESILANDRGYYAVGYGIRLTGLATLNVTDSTISGNGRDGIYGGYGTINLTRTTVMANGTGARSGLYGVLNVVNCTFTADGLATTDYPTGTIYSEGRLTISNSTFAQNVGQIVHTGSYPAVLRSSIVEDTGAGDIWGTIASGGHNVVAATYGGGFVPAATDRIASSANLGPLQNNGGLTSTFAPQPGSPAIDNGNAFCLTTDQRGGAYLRTVDDPSVPNAAGGDGTDSGAFEVQ